MECRSRLVFCQRHSSSLTLCLLTRLQRAESNESVRLSALSAIRHTLHTPCAQPRCATCTLGTATDPERPRSWPCSAAAQQAHCPVSDLQHQASPEWCRERRSAPRKQSSAMDGSRRRYRHHAVRWRPLPTPSRPSSSHAHCRRVLHCLSRRLSRRLFRCLNSRFRPLHHRRQAPTRTPVTRRGPA